MLIKKKLNYFILVDRCSLRSIYFSDYARNMIDELLHSYMTDRLSLMSSIDDIIIPGTLASGMIRPDKEEAVASYRARFNRN